MLKLPIILVVLAILVAAGVIWAPSDNESDTDKGVITWLVSPNAWVNDKLANNGLAISVQDTISTDDLGRVRYNVRPKIRECDSLPNSRITIHPTDHLVMRLDQGRIYCTTEPHEGEIIIQAGAAQITVDDPVFGVIVEGDRTTVKVTSGFVEVRSQASGSVRVQAGQQTTVVRQMGLMLAQVKPITLDEGEEEVFKRLEDLALAQPDSTTTTPTPTLPANTPTVSSQTLTPAVGLPFPEVSWDPGDWVKLGRSKYVAGKPGTSSTMSKRFVETAFGEVLYQGFELELRSSSGVGELLVLFLQEKNSKNGQRWVAFKFADSDSIWCLEQQLALPQPGRFSIPELPEFDINRVSGPNATFMGTDTYQVPELGQEVKVWKYHDASEPGAEPAPLYEVWISNEVPFYLAKMVISYSNQRRADYQLLDFGRGDSPLPTLTATELEANCK